MMEWWSLQVLIMNKLNYTQRILKYPVNKLTDMWRLTFPELVQSFIHVDEDVDYSGVVLMSY